MRVILNLHLLGLNAGQSQILINIWIAFIANEVCE
jgi:hypothetical protein